RVRGGIDAQGSEARGRCGAKRWRLHADGRGGGGVVPALRRPRRRQQGLFRYHQDDRRQVEGQRPITGEPMRVAMFVTALPLVLLAACGNQGTTASSTQANASGNATAEAKAGPLGAPLAGDEAKKLMHERHEGMEEIGDGF